MKVSQPLTLNDCNCKWECITFLHHTIMYCFHFYSFIFHSQLIGREMQVFFFKPVLTSFIRPQTAQRCTTTGYSVPNIFSTVGTTCSVYNCILAIQYFFSVSLPSLGSGIIESGSGPAFYAEYPSGSILGFYDHKLTKNFWQKLQFSFP
jgi:hypothetical protein